MSDRVTITAHFRTGETGSFVIRRTHVQSWGWRVDDVGRRLIIRPEKGVRHEIPFDSLLYWTVDTRASDPADRADGAAGPAGGDTPLVAYFEPEHENILPYFERRRVHLDHDLVEQLEDRARDDAVRRTRANDGDDAASNARVPALHYANCPANYDTSEVCTCAFIGRRPR